MTKRNVTAQVGPEVDRASRRVTAQAPANTLDPSPVQAAARVHDKAVGIMDAKWGTDVLPTLVSADLAAKFTRASIKRGAAIEGGNEAEIVDALHNVVRGLAKLDEAATEAGRVPLALDRYWATRDAAGNPWLFVQSEEDTRVAARLPQFKGYQVWSLPEVMRVLQDKSLESVLKAKALWPESKVEAVKPPVDWLDGDHVPF